MKIGLPGKLIIFANRESVFREVLFLYNCLQASGNTESPEVADIMRQPFKVFGITFAPLSIPFQRRLQVRIIRKLQAGSFHLFRKNPTQGVARLLFDCFFNFH